MSQLSGNEYFKAVEGLDVTQVPDGFVVYDESRDIVHYLNPTAAVVYSVCDGKRTVFEISDFLRDVYEIDEGPDLEDLFANLEGSGLVCRVT